MKKTLACALGGAAVLAVLFGSGSAAANNEYAGLTYEVANYRAKGGAVIATRVGSYLPTAKCLVIGSRPGTNKVLVDLDCNDTSALNGHPGHSVANPEAEKVHKMQATARNLDKDYAEAVAKGTEPYCASHLENCQKICDVAGNCSDELLSYLGS